MKRKSTVLLKVFFIAFLFNLLWEFLHIHLYREAALGFSGYAPAVFEATIWDACYITLVYLGMVLLRRDFFWVKQMNREDAALVALAGFLTATWVELRALRLGNWAYSPLMPLVPYINVGLTPFLQLSVLSLATFSLLRHDLWHSVRM